MLSYGMLTLCSEGSRSGIYGTIRNLQCSILSFRDNLREKFIVINFDDVTVEVGIHEQDDDVRYVNTSARERNVRDVTNG